MQRNQQKQKVNRTWLHVHWLFSLIDIYVQTRCSSTLEGNNGLYKHLAYDIVQQNSQTIGVSRMPTTNSNVVIRFAKSTLGGSNEKWSWQALTVFYKPMLALCLRPSADNWVGLMMMMMVTMDPLKTGKMLHETNSHRGHGRLLKKLKKHPCRP